MMNKIITYFVNGEGYESTEHKLTVTSILSNAGLTSPENYRLIRDNGNKPLTDYEEVVSLHDNIRFTALF
ncbi:hypothetical protein J2S10_005154 [Neobacillus ginsengisoli]|uniref:Uncharacterized protein n=2 Tax=Neobacillus ginsengisoli TaxID=904295 RepID=A0ABT9Y2S3_9BACI|nr:hypothetical protein [Neobacillus ginsengisoli]